MYCARTSAASAGRLSQTLDVLYICSQSEDAVISWSMCNPRGIRMSIVNISHTTVTNPSTQVCALGVCCVQYRPQYPESGNGENRYGDGLSSERWPCISPMSWAHFHPETGNRSQNACRVHLNNRMPQPESSAPLSRQYQGRGMSEPCGATVPRKEPGVVR